MLRRVKRILRTAVFVVGLLLVAWFPVSFFVVANALGPFRGGMLVIGAGGGVAHVSLWHHVPGSEWEATAFWSPGLAWPNMLLLPTYSYEPTWPVTSVATPLWLLAVFCLAWPVTSFIVARKHKRAFPVEPLTPPPEAP